MLLDKDMAYCSLDPNFLFSGGGEESVENINSQTLKVTTTYVDCMSFPLFLEEFLGVL